MNTNVILMNALQSEVAITLFTVLGIACLVGFLLCQRAVGGNYLDLVFSRQEAQTLVDGLSREQANKHLRVTCSLDIIFPICYGFVLGGFALRASPQYCIWSLLPALFAVLSDFCENATHIIALKKKKVPQLKPLFSVLKWIFIINAVEWIFLLRFCND